jgi:threonine dehydrogenase-like Zn-dependent dehydrogenase
MEAFRADKEMQGNPGHELAGEIADSCGNETLREGQRIAVHAVTSCGHCYWCQQGFELYCENLRGIGNGHAEYVAVPARHCLPLPDEIDWDTGLMVGGDTLGVAYHASTRAQVKANDVAVVMGAGPVGLGHVVLLSFWGLRVAAVDTTPYRLDLAKKLGAEKVINAAEENVVTAARSFGDGRGADFVFDCVGRPETLQLSMQAARPRGTVVIIGERGETPIYPSRDIIHKELSFFGSWYFLRREFYSMVELVRRGMRPAQIITHHLPLARAQEAYELMDAGQCGKIVFDI